MSRADHAVAEGSRLLNCIGSSPPMQAVFDTVLQVAPSRASVLITGEAGAGKERIAAALHAYSARVRGPFVKQHCAALSETQLDNELFGHDGLAFAGAAQRRAGRLQQADGGTLFLDDIGEISAAVQVKLLRFLQERELERADAEPPLKLDVRVIAATHRDLRELVRRGLFREDLYYRLNVVSIEVPPLRARASDIGPLAQHFLFRYAEEHGKSIAGFDSEATTLLLRHRWPGNVRELENVIERAVVICRGETICGAELVLRQGNLPRVADCPPVPGSSLATLERFAILKTLEHVGGSTARAAAILDISRRKIQYKLQAYLNPGLAEDCHAE
jgi:two-component system NtrC family response regulator